MQESVKEREKRVSKIKSYVERGILNKTTFYEELCKFVEKYNGRIAIIDDEREVTYTQLKINADKLAGYFYSQEIGKGDVVGVQLQNTILFTEVCFAFWKIGAIPMLLMPSLRINDMIPVFDKISPVAYIGPDLYLGFDYNTLSDEIKDRFPCVKHAYHKKQLEELVQNDSLKFECDSDMPQVEYIDPAVVLLSSGTTGKPKLILRTHAEYVFSVINGYLRVNETPEDVYLLSVPVQHVFGFAQPGMLGAVFSGAKLIMTCSMGIDEIFDLVEKYKVTIMGLVPSMLGLMAEVLQWYEVDLSLVRIVLTGGAPLSIHLRKRLVDQRGIKILQGYGFSEGLVATNLMEDEEEIAAACQGKPLSEYDIIRIVDDDGNDVAEGEAGELIANGPTIVTGYFGNEEMTKEVFRDDGFYCSGDYARITKEGNIQVIGRVREQINRCGEKIMPSEIEKILIKHPNVSEATVVGVPDDAQGQTVCAFIVANNDNISMKELNQFLQNQGVGVYKHLEYMYILDKMPVTGVGKLDRKALEKLAINNKGD